MNFFMKKVSVKGTVEFVVHKKALLCFRGLILLNYPKYPNFQKKSFPTLMNDYENVSKNIELEFLIFQSTIFAFGNGILLPKLF